MIRSKLLTLSFAAAACALPGPAFSHWDALEPVYHIYYREAPNGGGVTGIHYGDCTLWGPVTHAWLEGSTSPYPEYVHVAYCDLGEWYPL